MRTCITLLFTLSLAFLANAGIFKKTEAENRLNAALARNDQAAAASYRQQIESAEEVIRNGKIVAQTLLLWIPGVAIIAGGEGTCVNIASLSITNERIEFDENSMDCWKKVVDTMDLSPEANDYYTTNGMPIQKLLEHSDIRVYGPTETEPLRFVRNGVEFIPRKSYSNEKGLIVHIEAKPTTSLIETCSDSNTI
ncbi:MAG: hypothetical protein EOP45_16480 [Sphingobacteriaceae bacterium]|nr:MAG: hypothetical protein EOP45_16480 [Sphingobacteriaceae bacterium]